MLSLNFLYAAGLITIGIAAHLTGHSAMEAPLRQTAIFFGGAALICALFAIKHRRHGLVGAGFLSFLALLTGGSRFFSLIRERKFDFADDQVKLLCAFLGVSALYLAATIIKWRSRPVEV